MANIECYSVEVKTRLVLNKRELELLNHICSYGGSEFARVRESGHYHGGVAQKEIENFMVMMREVTSRVMHQLDKPEEKIFK